MMTLFMTVKEVAAHYGVTPRCVRSWCKAGTITPVKRVGNMWVISYAHLPPLSIIRNNKDLKACNMVIPQGRPGRPRLYLPKVNKYDKPGRPKGTTGTYYPKGVKRPRKKVK